MNSKTLLALFLFTTCAAIPASAIELSLEENKAERGNIGYIDMQRLFRTFPETIRARENFEELVRQAEEQLNLRKAEILRTRSELSELKIEREFMAKTPIEISRPGEKGAAAEAPKGAAAIAAAAEAAARERRTSTTAENPDLSKVAPPKQPTASAETPAAPTAPSQPAPAPAAPAPAAPEATAPVPPPQAAPAAPQTAQQPAPEATAPAAGGGRRGAEPETDLTRPSIANLPGFGAPTPSTGPAAAAPGYATPQQFAGAPTPSTAPAAPAAPPAAPTTDENMREALEQSRRAAEAKKREPLVINIPGVSTAPIVVQPPAEQAPAPAVAEKPATPPPAAALPVPAAPAAAPAAGAAAPSNLNPALVELDARIAVKQKELDGKEIAYKSEQSNSEKNLLDLESRKTEILLGKIHRAVQEVAHREGVSVVVDKSSILYGHDAVDLTDKVMKYLRGS